MTAAGFTLSMCIEKERVCNFWCSSSIILCENYGDRKLRSGAVPDSENHLCTEIIDTLMSLRAIIILFDAGLLSDDRRHIHDSTVFPSCAKESTHNLKLQDPIFLE
jgi:hypothetical protein